jgi:O-antigen/teichoic acid export membrane protein
LLPKARLALSQIKGYIYEFYEYSAPLLFFGFIGLINGLQDRWFLQSFAGSVEQGFYGLSYQIGALCFLVSGSMTPLFWREIAKAFGEKDQEKMSAMYRSYVPLLYTIAAFLAVFVTVQARKVTLLVGGNDFQAAAVPISIMALYPLHQTYGQLNGTFLLAVGQTRLYRNIGLGMMVVDLLLTFWLIAPIPLHGLGLGAAGLAIKMVIVQVIGVNLQLWFICRFLRLRYMYFLFHQVYSVLLLVTIAWLSVGAVDLVIKNTLLAFVSSGMIYVLGCAGLVLLLPQLIALSRAELLTQADGLWLAALRILSSPR